MEIADVAEVGNRRDRVVAGEGGGGGGGGGGWSQVDRMRDEKKR